MQENRKRRRESLCACSQIVFEPRHLHGRIHGSSGRATVADDPTDVEDTTEADLQLRLERLDVRVPPCHRAVPAAAHPSRAARR